MELGEFILILSKLGMGAIATFFAILLWSRTRDIAWVLVIIGTLIHYAEVVFSTLVDFGILAGEELWNVTGSGIPVFKILLVNLPVLFYSIAFLTVIARRRFPS